MKVVLVGSGNVATVLGRRIKKAGHTVLQVLSRTLEHAKILAEELGCEYTGDNRKIYLDADIYIFAVSDAGLYSMDDLSAIGPKLTVHTAGSVPMDVLNKISASNGVLYPLQSLRKEMNHMQDIPLLVNGNTVENAAIIEAFARTLSGTVSQADDEQRLKLHVAAVVVSNFCNHLYTLAEDFCKKEDIDFKILAPLIEETAHRIIDHSPAEVQTGPAFRKDIFTLDKHLRLLSNYPKLRYIYLKLTDSIMTK